MPNEQNTEGKVRREGLGAFLESILGGMAGQSKAEQHSIDQDKAFQRMVAMETLRSKNITERQGQQKDDTWGRFTDANNAVMKLTLAEQKASSGLFVGDITKITAEKEKAIAVRDFYYNKILAPQKGTPAAPTPPGPSPSCSASIRPWSSRSTSIL